MIDLGDFDGYKIHADNKYFYALKDGVEYSVNHDQQCFPAMAKVIEECQKRFKSAKGKSK